MRAYRSLQRQGDFTRLYRRGKRFSAPIFVLYAIRIQQSERVSKIGVSVSKAVGKAVHRNLVRRRVQCAFDSFEPAAYGNLDLLVVAKPGAAEAPFAMLSTYLRSALAQARNMAG